jgi:hypothetical protein
MHSLAAKSKVVPPVQSDDEAEYAAKREGRTVLLKLVFLFLCVGAVYGVSAWLEGRSFASFERDLMVLLGVCYLYWLLAPYYYEFRFRTKEINRKVSAIESALSDLTKQRSELFEKLSAVEKKLDSIARVS